MSMGGGGDATGSTQTPAAQPAASQPAFVQSSGTEAAKSRAVPGSLVPRTPDMWKMSSALIGVLLLGAGVLLVLKRMRGGVMPIGKTQLATLRQTVRLTGKQAVHAIEFDGRILLIGETDKSLSLLDRGSLPEAVSDEATVLARQQEEDDDDGAVPRNLLIPRPEHPTQRTATQGPATHGNSAQRASLQRGQAQGNTGRGNTPSKADVAIAKLNDFRTLLEKAGR